MEKEIQKCLEVLRAGGTILYPTDTIWGIGCDATNEKAVEKVYTVKKNPSPQGEGQGSASVRPFIVLVSDDGMLNRFIKDVPAQAWDLIEVSDKPITIIYDNARGFAKNVLADDGSIAVRLIKDDFCQRLIHKFGKPIVSTSANTGGEPAPQNYDAILENIKNKVDYIVNWRQDDFSKTKPSSIIKLKANGEFVIVRK